MPRRGYKKPLVGDADDPDGLVVWSRRYVDHLRVRAYSPRTIRTTESCLSLFTEWAWDRGLTKPTEITRPILESYQKWLFYRRKPNGKPLTFSSQRVRMQKLRVFFRWLARQNVVLANPAADLELPRVPRRLPKAILTEREVEKVMAIADVTTGLGLRDRAMMEVLYSTGIRRAELAGLQLFEIDEDRGTVTIRMGKGRKDRVVPIGERALHWMGRYVEEVRPDLVVPPDEGFIFLDSEDGNAIKLARLTQLMKRYIDAADLGKTGACHIFRHSMATHMLEGGCEDIRLIQELLGHAEMSTTAIYTRISIKRLKRVHEQTHPAAWLNPKKSWAAPDDADAEATEEQLLAALDAEGADEDEDGVATDDDGG
jgi:integrase/recombinase XerD